MQTGSLHPPEQAHSAVQLDRPVTPDPQPGTQRPSLLPDSVKQPWLLLWIAVLPQLVLLLLNLRDYRLVSGEMEPWQKTVSAIIGASEVLLLIGVSAVALVWRSRGRLLSWGVCWALLIAPILYLCLTTYQLTRLLPASVIAWILPPQWVVYNQFAFMMPLIFYAAVRISSGDINISRRVEHVILWAIVIGIPLLLAGFFRWAPRWLFIQQISVAVYVVLLLAATLAVLGAALRLLVTVYVGVRKKGPLALGIFCFLVGIAGPIGGLLLNRKIPFPADFQSTAVYAMALVNGSLLLLPNFRHPLLHRSVWLAQCALFPFTFYFFVVFLPFLLFSIPAISMAGAGFLVLTPTALFLVHGQRLLDGYRNEVRDGSRLTPALLALAAVSILPGIYAAQAGLDRVVLRRAIDYVYSPNYRADSHFTGRPALVRRSLEHLRDFKAGLNLPFLSGFYNWVVFDGLVLPDEKMRHIHRSFFGHDLNPASPGGVFGARPSQQRTFRETTIDVPRNVQLVKTTATVAPEGACDRATIALQMQNNASPNSEFVTTIRLPEGVLVSGFWLHIGDQRVPGQLFEKKTALWVYQMIRDVSRRDPGLLLYTEPQTVELRVFPFAAREQRQVEIEFLYPNGLKPGIRIGAETLHPSGESDAATVALTRTGNGTAAATFSATKVAALPTMTRTPYLHFIVDRSANSDVTNESVGRTILATRAHFPDARECLISAANYETIDLTNGLVPIDSATGINVEALARRGGFLAARTMKRALLHYSDELSESTVDSPSLGKFPIVIVIRGTRTELLGETDLLPFTKLVPDVTAYYVTTNGSMLEPHDFAGKPTVNAHAIRPVALLKLGSSIAACDVSEKMPRMIDLAETEQADELSVFDPSAKSFLPLTEVAVIPPETRYSSGVAAWQNYFSLIYDPSRGNNGLAEIVKRSRESGIMVGATSFIVVENSAQWKMLERKQKQKLRNSTALEIEAVPEPTTWCLIIVGAAFLLFCLRKKRA